MSKKNAPVSKNQQFDVEIFDLTYLGMGVAKIEDFPIFVANAVPGETVKIGITKVASSYAFARVIKVLVESDNRNNDVNADLVTTGIAPLANLKYPAQLKFKQQQIEALLKKQHLDIPVAETIGMENPFGYRNKAQVPVREIKGQLETGFYRRNSHNLVPIEDYFIQDPEIDKAVNTVRDILRKYHVAAYDEINHRGVVRTVMVRRGYYSHEMMIVIVTKSRKLPMQEVIVDEIRAALPEVTSIIQNINQDKTNVILGEKNVVLWGNKVIFDTLLGLKFAIGPNSFYQVNPQTTENLYTLAAEKAELTGDEVVIDAYSGIGTISLTIAPKVKQVYGVEIVPGAIDDAKRNADMNNIKNVKFTLGKAEEQMVKWAEADLKPDVIFVDPPRKGLTGELISAAVEMAPKKIVYISCNPATLTRDLEEFKQLGYEVKGSIQPVDQFPQTTHVESIAVLEKN
ncbi:23S rRNA (uracil(1939)-C(5))-methyltransferase RlmD [Periweissella ghanensis]|uniref:RNA methyltransferase n=1 Tax=Periweissella ghanensis TaxID=467997 RepID=A0ABM8ZD33_9LACO|nr:23S rRNA (uracil(1939)-C(5))-methyltransferase RlmD [Periweissella ghanensis]MCM0600785.1 23S rRNA (uracil(1939)-C(5))-methyltransferase RlmD [Periweissella ghanensis]CAH0418573.1 putative RNA methyltransferase [Periweissella ghanensis]